MRRLNKHEVRLCDLCGREFTFNAVPSKVRDGHGRFCSRLCQQRGRRTKTLAERFAKYASKRKTATGCILWKGGQNNGYGSIGGQLAHRVAYELSVRKIPAGLHVLHSCDNPLCVNTEHLFIGTNDDNVADKLAKNRQAKGEMFNRSLKDRNVVAIRSRAAAGESQTSLAKEFGVHQSHVSRIVRGLTWKHIPT